MSRLPEYCECSMPNSPKRCRIACGKERYSSDLTIFDFEGTIPEKFWNSLEVLKKELAMKTNTPTILWFSNQDSVGIWDVPEVLDKMEAWLTEQKESFRRYPPHEENPMGHLDIFCTTAEHYQKIRTAYNKLRGLLE